MARPADEPKPGLDEVLVRCQDRLRTRIRWMMGEGVRRQQETGDLLGELMSRILDQADRLQWRDESHFLALATRMARNMIIDSARRPQLQRFESLTTDLSAGKIEDIGRSTPSAHAAREEDIEQMFQGLESLSEDQQTVVELRHFEGLPFKEIGVRMGKSENAVQVMHARALVKLSGKLRRGRGA